MSEHGIHCEELVADCRLRAATDLLAHTWDPVVLAALAGQLVSQRPRRLRRPPRRRHRVAPLLGLDQGQQRRPRAWVEIDGALAPAADSADPTPSAISASGVS